MSTSRAYVGILPDSGRVVFRESREPVADRHPEYTYAVGPFRTRAAADYFAAHSECRTVRDAERAVRKVAAKPERYVLSAGRHIADMDTGDHFHIAGRRDPANNAPLYDPARLDALARRIVDLLNSSG